MCARMCASGACTEPQTIDAMVTQHVEEWVCSCSHSPHYITVPTGQPVNQALVRKKDANLKKNSSFVKKLVSLAVRWH